MAVEPKFEIVPGGNAVTLKRDGEIIGKFCDRKQARKVIDQLKAHGVYDPTKPM